MKSTNHVNRIFRLLLWLVLLLFSLALIRCGVWFIIPANNPLAHGPLAELIEQCSIPGTPSTIRLYRIDTFAMDAYGYTVTFQENSLVTEQTIFSSQGFPEIEHVQCNAQRVTLVGGPVIAVNELKYYLAKPDVSNEGRPAQLVFNGGIGTQVICTLCGLSLILFGFLPVMFVLARRRTTCSFFW